MQIVYVFERYLLQLISVSRCLLPSLLLISDCLRLLNSLLPQYEGAELLFGISTELSSNEDIPMNETIIESFNS